jgi:hypothetical protein
MDRITRSLLDEFSKDAGITSLAEDRRFEHFASHLAVSRHLSETFDTADTVVGEGGDTGIDAVAVLVNGGLVTDPELVEELAATNGYIDATFLFVQAERSASFETQKIGQFGFGVSDFFKERPTLPRNDRVKEAAEVMAAVYERSSKFKRGNPVCRLFYVTTGTWTGDANLEARKAAVVEDLEALRIFRDVEFRPLGAGDIQKVYQQLRNAIARDFVFSERTVIPEMKGVKEAYLGLLPAKQFLALLDDGAGNILKTIFYDNVRDWQDYNLVNTEIKATLESAAQRPRFALMNNGITVIAKTLRATGNKFHIEDYQIVNGCQTSHVLFDNAQLLDDTVLVPLRLIASDDEEVIASIVKATNRQTEVKEEQLLALSDFQKRIESYFQTFPEPQRLYYERRSRQYSSAGIEKTRIVTPSSLIRAYASIFREEPHRTTRTYRALLQQLGRSIFGPTDRLEPYYYAASALYRLEFLFRNNMLPARYKPARYHILLAARLLSQPAPPPPANSHAMERYCKPLLDIIWNDAGRAFSFADAAEVVEETAGGNFDNDSIRTQGFTELLKEKCVARAPATP